MSKQAIRWDLTTLSDDEHEKFVQDILEDISDEVAVVTEIEQVEAIQQRLEDTPSPRKTIEESPQLFEGANPELILILFESTLVLLEGGRITKELYQIYQDRKEADDTIEMVDEKLVLSSLNGGGG